MSDQDVRYPDADARQFFDRREPPTLCGLHVRAFGRARTRTALRERGAIAVIAADGARLERQQCTDGDEGASCGMTPTAHVRY